MRDVSAARAKVTDDVVAAAAGDLGMTPYEFFETELAAYALATAAPGQSIEGVPALLDGHGAVRALGMRAAVDATTRVANARVVVGRPISPHRWRRQIAAYRRIPERLRGFAIDDDGVVAQRQACAVASDRFTVFEDLLTLPLPFAVASQGVAGPGTYKVTSASSARRLTVDIPSDLPVPPPVATHMMHDLRSRGPVLVTWAELRATAEEMDRHDVQVGRERNWAKRVGDTTLLVRGVDNRFTASEVLSVDGLLHMAGMVSAGKTTLIQIIAVWAAKTGRQVTIVLGDNSSVFDLVTDVNSYVPGAAAPILGQRGRGRQLTTLHKRHAPDAGELALADTGFEWVSTACALSALLDEDDSPLGVDEAPCEALVEYDARKDGLGQRAWFEGPKRRCPLWGGCQRHRASRALVDAPIWVGTHWGLTYTRVPAAVSDLEMRYLEAAWRRSDLFLVDEVDRVQTGLDATFARSQTLFGPGKEAWVDQISQAVYARLRQSGRAELANAEVQNFNSALGLAKTLGDIVYKLLHRDAQAGGDVLRKWMGPEYFTSWTLSARLCRELTGYDPRAEDDPAAEPPEAYEILRSALDEYIDAPDAAPGEFEEPLTASLAELNSLLLINADEERLTSGFEEWIGSLQKDPRIGEAVVVGAVETAAMRLQLVLVTALFSYYLNQVLYAWPTASRLLNVDGEAYQQSPRDLRPLAPEPPMGTILGFQLVTAGDGVAGTPGELQFFEATSVGRALLLDLPNMFPADGPGPNAILLSGTSWAGTSPRYHVDVRVDAVLKPADELLERIDESTFELRLQHEDEPGTKPIRVSGVQGDQRLQRLRRLTECLLRRDTRGRSEIQAEIDALPAGRKKILLIVGSYGEARAVFETFRARSQLRARYLVSDGSSDGWVDGEEHISRGDVASFGFTDDDVLIAPLLAVERGHNILNEQGVAAIGAAYFLVRPHPSPQDVAWVTQSLNARAMQRLRRPAAIGADEPGLLAQTGSARRRGDQQAWRRLLQTEIVYARLFGQPDVRDQLVWTQIVTMWQVIGRLVRGGQPARVYFCDAAFAPSASRGRKETDATSLLLGMRAVLDRYCSDTSVDPDRHLVRALYGPMHRALTAMKGI